MSRHVFALLLLLSSAAILATSKRVNENLNLFPVIGVIAKPSEYDQYPSANWTYLAASYVKFIEAAGARVVPIVWNLPLQNLTVLMRSLNGILIPGGSDELTETNSTLTPFGKALENIINLVIQINDEGTHYPLWGTCMGFQAIACVIAGQSSGNYNCLYAVEGLNSISRNLYFYEEGQNSEMYTRLSHTISQALQNNNITFFHANFTVQPDLWESNIGLKSNFTRLSYVLDDANNKITAAISGIKYPIYGSQFHPEKLLFEWNLSQNIPHSFEAIKSAQLYSTFFVNEARRNNNTFNNSGIDLDSIVIYNYNPLQLPNTSFDQIYFFPIAAASSNEEELVQSLDVDTKVIVGFLDI